jgi:L-seryl-tRNA(Ser) seleniumtransferase
LAGFCKNEASRSFEPSQEMRIMATKSPDSRYRIPSVSDLLEMPAVRAVADRLNRSVVASGVRSFLDELRSDLERRTSDIHLPSLRELAERAARHVARLRRSAVRGVINATGRLVDPSWIGRPLAEEALEQLVALGEGYARQLGGYGHNSATPSTDVATALARLTGGEAATVVHSYTGAIWITLAGIAGGKEFLIARAESGDVESNCSIRGLANSAGATAREVGTTNRVSISDYESAISGSAGAILKHRSDSYHIVGETQLPDWGELVALARDRELPLIQAAGSAPLVDDLPAIGGLVRSAAADIAAGAQLVIARGDGLVGGPPCGLIVGSRDLVNRIEAHPAFGGWRIDPLRAAALEATIDAYDDRQRLEQSVPLFQLLTASVDNLRQRAERLAPQLAQAESIAAAEPVPTENSLGIACCSERTLPSYGIALSASDGNLRALDDRLRSAAVPVVGRLENDRLVLDLRTVFPRQDRRLVEIIVGGAEAANEQQPDPVPAGD